MTVTMALQLVQSACCKRAGVEPGTNLFIAVSQGRCPLSRSECSVPGSEDDYDGLGMAVVMKRFDPLFATVSTVLVAAERCLNSAS